MGSEMCIRDSHAQILCFAPCHIARAKFYCWNQFRVISVFCLLWSPLRDVLTAGGRRDCDFLVQRSRFLAALKTRLGLILAKAVAMRVMINATVAPGLHPAPVLDRNHMKTHKRLSQLIASSIDHDLPTPV